MPKPRSAKRRRPTCAFIYRSRSPPTRSSARSNAPPVDGAFSSSAPGAVGGDEGQQVVVFERELADALAHEVAHGEHADHLPRGVRDRQVTEATLRHELER